MAKRRLFQFPVKWVTEENVHQVITGGATFGQKGDRFHRGADIGENAGEAIYSIAAGVVYDFGNDDDEAGNYVIIQHDEASYSYYLHMMGRSNYDVGQPVGLNDVIGYVGSTGWSTGPHIHFGVSGVPTWSGWVDPVQYVLDRYWYDDGQPDYTSHLNAVQQDQLAGWIGQTYGARQYWSDVQAISRDRGWYAGSIDGIPGPLTFDAEHRLWADVFDRPVAPEPTPEPEQPFEPVPIPRPIEEDPVTPVTPMPVDPGPPIHPGHSKGAMEALRNMLSPTVRVYIYVIFGVIGVALGTWQTWLVSTDQLAPWYFGGIVAVYAYLGTFIAILAAPNTNKADA